MNLHSMNEAFKNRYSNCINESVDESDKAQLKKALIMRSMNVVASGGNIKDLEIALQDVIESFYPDKCWWEVTGCNIFMELLNGSNPREVCDSIVDQMKSITDESALDDTPITESSGSRGTGRAVLRTFKKNEGMTDDDLDDCVRIEEFLNN